MNTNATYCLVTEAFGHGFASLLYAQAYGMIPVAYSDKNNESDYTAQVKQIINNLSFFEPSMPAVSWEDRKAYANEFNFRKELLAGNISAKNWQDMATTKLFPLLGSEIGLPEFASLSDGATLFVPQKLQSDGLCGATAEQQSLSPALFSFLKGENLALGQHFHKVNDLPPVEALAKEFNLYVPGMTEDKEVFGIRGIQHKMYWNFYRKMSACVGIAGTHTWYLLTCMPEVPQVILYRKGMEKWDEIEAAYRAAGYDIRCIGFDESTNMELLSKEIEAAYAEIKK